MRKASIGITPEGVPSIALTAFACLVFSLLGMQELALVSLGLVIFSCNFFRDPERVSPTEKGVAVSPADGKILDVSKHPDPITGEEKLRIAVFMNVFNVHVNRSPVEGTISAISYHPGLFFNASFDKASKDNERCSYQITDTAGDVWGMVQIAGLLARRIVCRVDENDTVKRGERFGMIKFGSRVDLYIPDSYTAAVSVGDKVLAGQTVLAKKGK